MKAAQHAIDLVGRVILNRNPGAEGLLALGPHDDHLQVGEGRELVEPLLEQSQKLQVEDVEGWARESQGGQSLADFQTQG